MTLATQMAGRLGVLGVAMVVPIFVMGIDPTNPYLTSKDKVALKLADAAMVEMCLSERPTEQELSDGREALESSLGGENFVLDNAKASTDLKDFIARIRQYISAGWVAKHAPPLVVGIIVLVFWLFCCWTACPCCRCCHCRFKRRQHTRSKKIVLTTVMVGCLIGIVIGLLAMNNGSSKLVNGFDSVSCGFAKAVDATLGGLSDPYFIGVMPILSRLNDLENLLNDESPILTEITAIVGKTLPVEDAVKVGMTMMSTLRGMLTKSNTLNPVTPEGRDLRHHCSLCERLADPLKNADKTLSTSVAKALAQVRTIVEEKTSSEERLTIKSYIRNGTKSLVDMKVGVRKGLQFFFEPDGLLRIRDQVSDYVPVVFNTFIGLAFLCFFFGFQSTCCWVCRERTTLGGGVKRYSRAPHRIACCTMCLAVPLFVVPALLLGGILDAASTGLSAVCLTLDGMDGARFVVLSKLVEMKEDDAKTMATLIDSCRGGASGANPSMLDLINVTNETSGRQQTMRQHLYELSIAPIERGFAKVDTSTEAEKITPLFENPSVVELIQKLQDIPLTAAMLPVVDKFTNDPEYYGLLADPELRVALGTSSRCENVTFNGTSVPGILNFLEKFAPHTETNLTSLKAPNCLPAAVDCTDPWDFACPGGRSFIDLKRRIVEDKMYSCDLWQDSRGFQCDPKDMVKNAAGEWINDCLVTNSNGTKRLLPMRRMCNLTEFTNYIQDYSMRIQKSFERMADVVTDYVEDLDLTLRGIVKNNVVEPFNQMTDGVTCGYIPPAYDEVISGLCFQGVVGVREIGKSCTLFGASLLAMAVALYFAWRIERDNVKLQATHRESCGSITDVA